VSIWRQPRYFSFSSWGSGSCHKSSRHFVLRDIEIGQRSSMALASNVSEHCNVLCICISLDTGCELTGDTVQFGKSAWGDARNASVMCVNMDFAFTHDS